MYKGISGKPVLIDTNILIYQLNGRLDLSDELSSASHLYISAVTEAELFAGVNRADLLEIKGYLEIFTVLPVSSEIAKLAGGYKAVFKSYGLKDLLIAATAQLHNLTLVTANKKDFEGLLTKKIVKIEV